MYRYDAFVGVGKRGVAQPFIDKRLVDAARTHRVIVRLKGGHPMLFGRAQEEIAALVLVGPQFRARPCLLLQPRVRA